MKKILLILALLGLPLANAQTVHGRWDSISSTVTGSGQLLPMLAIPGSYVNFYTGCTTLPCTTPAVTYLTQTSATTCPANAQVVWQYPVFAGCKATADSQGNFGGWFAAGSYQYTVTVSGHVSGPYAFDVGFGGGGSGGPVISTTDPVKVNGGNGPISFGPALISCAGGTCGPELQMEDTDLPLQTKLDFNSTTPAAPGTNVNCAWQHDSAGRVSCNVPLPTSVPPAFDMQVIPPIAGNYVIVYPTGGVITSDPPNLSNIFGGTDKAGGHFVWQCSGLLCSIAGNTQAHWTGFALPAGINPANVTAIYADAITTSGQQSALWNLSDTFSATSVLCNGQEMMLSQNSYPYNGTEITKLTGLTGATFNSTASCGITVGGSGPGSHGQYVDVAAVRFIVYSTDAPPPSDSAVHLQPPLNFNGDTNTFFLDESNNPAGYLQGYSVAFIPPAASFPQTLKWVTDTTNCSTYSIGAGPSLCYSDGSSWHLFSAGGGGSTTYFTEVVSCTTTCTLAHTPVTFDNLSVNGLVMISGTDFTRSGTTVTLTTPAVGGDVYYAQYHY